MEISSTKSIQNKQTIKINLDQSHYISKNLTEPKRKNQNNNFKEYSQKIKKNKKI